VIGVGFLCASVFRKANRGLRNGGYRGLVNSFLATLLLTGSPGLIFSSPVSGLPASLRGDLFESVVRILEQSFYDREVRAAIPGLAEVLREQGLVAPTSDRELVDRLLAELSVSHLALYSKSSYEAMRAELADRRHPTLGMQLVDLEGAYFADWILEGGPAQQAGVRRGDRVLSVDGEAPEASRRLDWSTDDAALPDPPIHALLCRAGDRVELVLEDSGGIRSTRIIEARPFSGTDAALASAQRFDLDGVLAGYVHFWFIANRVPSRILGELIEGEFADCDVLLLDLRGRGGHAVEVDRIARVLHPENGSWRRPVVLLTDGGTRSAKEVIAHRLREQGGVIQVGERTAGAVIPATFTQVASGAVLMYPISTLGRLTGLLEGRGVEPDVPVEAPLPHAGGKDPILEAGLIAARVWCREIQLRRRRGT
jgi:carboxyl-terminal processing protease